MSINITGNVGLECLWSELDGAYNGLKSFILFEDDFSLTFRKGWRSSLSENLQIINLPLSPRNQ